MHFSNNEAPAYNDVDAYKNVNIYSIDNYIILNSANELSGTIKVYDLMGREVYSEAISETFQHEISSVAIFKGYYILNFVSDSEVYTEKVFIK
ncbi:MAG: T9SS type A sorting domain-containing protein [Bacteroidales bacterium]